MSKGNAGLFTLIAGMAAGAAALFLSDPKNRAKTKKALNTAASEATKMKKEYEANPTAFKKKVAGQAKKTAAKAIKKAAATSKKVAKKAKTASKKTARK